MLALADTRAAAYLFRLVSFASYSCRDDYECSCEQLDSLVLAMKHAGAPYFACATSILLLATLVLADGVGSYTQSKLI